MTAQELEQIRLAYIANRRKEIVALQNGNETLYSYHAALADRAVALICAACGGPNGIIAVMDWEIEVQS